MSDSTFSQKLGQLLTNPPRAEGTHSVHYSDLFPCYLCHPSGDEVSSSRRSRDSCSKRWMLDLDSRQEIKASDGLVLPRRSLPSLADPQPHWGLL